jgi:hypothetical protein
VGTAVAAGDATVTAPVALAVGIAPLSDNASSVELGPPIASGLAVALTHAVSAQGNATVTVPETANAVPGALTHAVTASSTVTSPVALGLGQAPITGNEVSADITTPVAQGNATALTHSTGTSADATVTAVVADAVPGAVTHTVLGENNATVVAVVADAVSVALTHSVSITADVTIVAPVALAVGFQSAPVVSDGTTPTETFRRVPHIPTIPRHPVIR